MIDITPQLDKWMADEERKEAMFDTKTQQWVDIYTHDPSMVAEAIREELGNLPEETNQLMLKYLLGKDYITLGAIFHQAWGKYIKQCAEARACDCV